MANNEEPRRLVADEPARIRFGWTSWRGVSSAAVAVCSATPPSSMSKRRAAPTDAADAKFAVHFSVGLITLMGHHTFGPADVARPGPLGAPRKLAKPQLHLYGLLNDRKEGRECRIAEDLPIATNRAPIN
jgi:hypothetical protein